MRRNNGRYNVLNTALGLFVSAEAQGPPEQPKLESADKFNFRRSKHKTCQNMPKSAARTISAKDF